MARFWWGDGPRPGAPSSIRFTAWLVASLVLAGVTGGYVLVSEHMTGPAPRATPLRVMPLGDSITLGPDQDGGISGGWRPLLADELVHRDGLDVQFVGSQQSGTPPLDHEGHGGWRIDQIRAIVDGAMATYAPDVVLLHVGTNDVGQRLDLAGAPARLADLTARICRDRPGVDLVVASIIPIGSLEPLIDAYDATIPGIVGGLQQAGCRAHLVDMRDAVPSTELFDGVHPDRAGYAAMAAVWAPVVRSIYSGDGGTLPGSVDDDVLRYAGSWSQDHERPGAWFSDEHHSGSTGDVASWTFRGTGVAVAGATGPSGGIAAVSIDGGPDAAVDYYAPSAAEQVTVYRSPALAAGVAHTVRVRVTGSADPASTGTTVSLDRLNVTG